MKIQAKLLLYLDRTFKSISSHPNIEAHLAKFLPILVSRREVENGAINYYQLQWARTEDIFIGPKIVVPYRSDINTFAYNEGEWFCRSDAYVIMTQDNNMKLKYILALLNSRLYYLWLYYKGKRKGEMLELFQIPLSEIPIKRISSEEQQPFITLVDQILAVKQKDPNADTSDLEHKIDKMVYALYNLTPEEIEIVVSSFSENPHLVPKEFPS